MSLPRGAGADRLPCRLLDLVDRGEEVDELGVGLTENAHAAEVADIAVEVGAGIERQDFAGLQHLIRRRAVEAGSGSEQAISKSRPRLSSSLRSRSASARFCMPGRASANTASIEATTRSEASRSMLEFGGRLHGPQPLEREHGVGDLDVGEALMQRRIGVGGNEGRLDPDAPHGIAEFLQMADRQFGRVDACPRRRSSPTSSRSYRAPSRSLP